MVLASIACPVLSNFLESEGRRALLQGAAREALSNGASSLKQSKMRFGPKRLLKRLAHVHALSLRNGELRVEVQPCLDA